MTNEPNTALVICYSQLISDPRVVRQIDWLVADGWIVDTVGFGPAPRPSVRRHFELQPLLGFRTNALLRLLVHTLLSRKQRFRMLEGWQIPAEIKHSELSGAYDLILANEIDLLPWVVGEARRLLSSSRDAHCHVDIHEYHRWAPPTRHPRLARLLFQKYHAWLVSFIGNPTFATRSTVAAKLAELYARDFDIPLPKVVRNAPAFVDQSATKVNPAEINLVYHGYAELARGLHLLIEALPLLDERFVLNLMLTGSEESKSALATMSNPVHDRIRFIDAVPMNEVATALNRFDLELIFLPPVSKSFEFALPNKFFEAVQGRLGIVTGESPSMVEIVRQFDNGVVVEGWQAADLARSLNALSTERIQELKNASEPCAAALNSGAEAVAFRASITPEEI